LETQHPANGLEEQSISIITQYWSTDLGCAPEHFDAAQTLVVAHAGLDDYRGIYCVRHRHSLLISVPPTLLMKIQERAGSLTAPDLNDTGRVLMHLDDGCIERVIGPAAIAYADRATFQPISEGVARLLGPDDRQAVEQLQATCTAIEWEHGGGESDDPQAGVFVDGTLASLASYRVWGDSLAHLSIVTNPHYRGRGFGTAAISTLAEYALQHGLLLQYQTLQSNTASLRIATTLGFVPWATTLALRLNATGDIPSS
jgi:GNAT superfamily N-acetyltransferase